MIEVSEEVIDKFLEDCMGLNIDGMPLYVKQEIAEEENFLFNEYFSNV